MKKISFLLLVIFLFTFAGCNNQIDDTPTNTIVEKTTLEYGFTNIERGEETSPYFCAYKSDKRIFDIDNVVLELYFGIYEPYIYLEGYDPNVNLSMLLYIYTFTDNANNDLMNDPNMIVIREITDFFTEEYSLQFELDDEDYIKKVNYNHSELITIPKEVFVLQIGHISIGIKEYLTRTDGTAPEYGSRRGAHIFYKVDGDKVILSETEFK